MTSTSIIQPPQTIKEVWEQLPEGTRAQVIENQLIMAPAAPRGVTTTIGQAPGNPN